MTSAIRSLSRKPADQPQPSRELLLKQLAAARHAVCHRLLLAKPIIDRPAAVRVADQLVGLALIWHFIEQRLPNSAPNIQKIFADAAGQTLNAVVERLKNQLSSPILRMVCTSSDWDDALPLPDGLHQTFLAPRHQLPRVSLTSFGDLHQLCLSDRMEATKVQRRSNGVRRSRGIHYTPHEIVEYLVDRVFEQLSIPNNSDVPVRFRMLDPSCGCGAFLASVSKLRGPFHLIRSIVPPDNFMTPRRRSWRVG